MTRTRPHAPLSPTLLLISSLFAIAALPAGCGKDSDGTRGEFEVLRFVDELPSTQLAMDDPGPERVALDVAFDTRSVVSGHYGVEESSIRTTGGELHYTTTDPKSWIDVAIDIEADEVSEVLIEAWRSTGHHRLGLLWTPEVDGRVLEPAGRGSRMDVFHKDEASDVTVFSMRVDRDPSWRGRIRALRIWGGNRPGLEVVIKSIRLVHQPADRAWYAEHPNRRDGKIEIEDETRVALLARAPSRYELTTTIPENGRIALGHTLGGAHEADATRFVVRLEHEGAEPVVLLDRTLRPKRDGEPQGDRGWQDVNLALDGLTGEEATIILETMLPEGVSTANGEASTPAYWSDPVLYVPNDSDTKRRPNILLVSLDTLRADHLGTYGYPHPTSPNFDRFAKQNTFFESLVSQAASTGPSHMSLFLSTYPTAHGIVNHERKLPDHAVTMAEIYRAAGYTTGAFTEGGYITAGIGFHQGFSSYAEVVLPLEGRGGFVDITFPRAIDWMERHDDRPFLLFVQTYQIHVPYCAGDPWDDLFTSDDYAGPLGPCLGYGDLTAMNYEATGLDHKNPVNRGKAPATEDDLAWVVAGYDSEIRKADSYFQQLLDALDRLDLADDTIVIAFSDHGEDFRDHLAIGRHARSLYEEMLHVPLAVRIPGRYSRTTIREPVAMVDWLPTLLELTDVETDSKQRQFGRSLVPVLEGKSTGERPDFFAENYSQAVRAMVRRGDWKLIETREFEDEDELRRLRAEEMRTIEIRGLYLGDELYDLANDPAEKHNLLEDYPDRADELRAALHEFLQEQREASLGSGGRAVNNADIERLIALGYVDEDENDEDEKDEREKNKDDETRDGTSRDSDR